MKIIKALGWALIWVLAVFIVSCQLIQDLPWMFDKPEDKP